MVNYDKKNTTYQLLLIFFYVIVLICWFFVIFYRFFSGTDYNDSYVITSYLVDGVKSYQLEVHHRFVLTFVDIFVKTNLTIFSWVLGTIFILFRILPVLKRLNYIFLILAFLFAYIPSVFSIVSFLSHIGEAYQYITFREFILLILMYPLNFAVFFYFYYLLDMLFLNSKEK